MTAAQNWTLLGLVGGLIAALLATVSAMVAGLQGEIRGGFGDLRGSMGDLRGSVGELRMSMDARFEAQERITSAGFDAVGSRLNSLDRDVQALADQVFRDRP